MRDSLRRSQRLLALGAWTLLGLVVLGYLSEVPGAEALISRSGRAGALATDFILGLELLAFLATWAGAVWHALERARAVGVAPSKLLILALALCNGVGGFFYYFGWVAWRPSRATA